MSTYVVRPDRAAGIFAEFVVHNTATRRPVTRCATPAAAARVAEALNASEHTSHRRRRRMPLWYVFVMAWLRAGSVCAVLAYLFGKG